jgi:hypothetical protein
MTIVEEKSAVVQHHNFSILHTVLYAQRGFEGTMKVGA